MNGIWVLGELKIMSNVYISSGKCGCGLHGQRLKYLYVSLVSSTQACFGYKLCFLLQLALKTSASDVISGVQDAISDILRN